MNIANLPTMTLERNDSTITWNYGVESIFPYVFLGHSQGIKIVNLDGLKDETNLPTFDTWRLLALKKNNTAFLYQGREHELNIFKVNGLQFEPENSLTTITTVVSETGSDLPESTMTRAYLPLFQTAMVIAAISFIRKKKD